MTKIIYKSNGWNFGEAIFDPLFRHWVPAFPLPKGSKLGILSCIMDQLCVIAGVGQNSISCRFFVCEGAGMGPCILEVHEICAILVKSTDSWLWGRIDSCQENFVFFQKKNDHYLVLGVVMEVWW